MEKADMLGGTSTRAYVCAWGPGPGGPLAKEIHERLAKLPQAVGITSDHNADRKKGSFGLWLITPGQQYEQTLRRIGLSRAQTRAVVFDPGKLSQVALGMLAETGRCRVMLNTTFTTAETKGKRISAIGVESADAAPGRIEARVFVDCTGGGFLCRKVGCETMLGPEPAERFGEPGAPKAAGKTLNAISLCYRIRKSDRPARQAAPVPAVAKWPRSAHVSEVPGGDLIVNPLAMMPGERLIEKGYLHCMAECKRIAAAQWRWLQERAPFDGYEFHSFAAALGIRESYRVVGEYVLTQHDLIAGAAGQEHRDLVTFVEQPIDFHGPAGKLQQIAGPYGVPYRCLVPKGRENLLVAGRCASFSHIAAASCRLSRNMLALGHAAGLGAAIAAKNETPVANVDVAAIQKQLGVPVKYVRP